MTRATAVQLGGQNMCAFLDALTPGEGTNGVGDDGYNVLVGGTLFVGYAVHPARSIWLPRYKVYSTAAGRYQQLLRTWTSVRNRLGLPDFSPVSQDLAAVELIRGRGAYEDVIAGRFELAVQKCAKEWASLPGAGYGQRELAFSKLHAAYAAAGGSFA